MKKSFEDTKIGRVLSMLTDVIFSGILWLLCSLPIITIGASSAALYYVTVKSIRRERGRLAKSFFAAFRSNFVAGLKLWLIYIVYVLVWLANNYALGMMGELASPLMGALVKLMLVPALLPLPWVFAYISRFDNSLGASIKYACYLCVKNFWRTLLLILMLGAAAAVGWLMPAIIPLLPGALCLSMSYFIEPVFKGITETLHDGNADQWYNE